MDRRRTAVTGYLAEKQKEEGKGMASISQSQAAQDAERARAAAEAAAREAARRAAIMRKISEKRGKMNSAITVRNTLSSLKQELDTEISDWTAADGRLTGDSEAVVIPDVFEGEMAESLKGHVSDVKSAIKDGISASQDLSDATQTQIDRLNAHIADLQTQISSLYQQL